MMPCSGPRYKQLGRLGDWAILDLLRHIEVAGASGTELLQELSLLHCATLRETEPSCCPRSMVTMKTEHTFTASAGREEVAADSSRQRGRPRAPSFPAAGVMQRW